jgi:pyrimidine operon attenuation protein / uracil phosphoribosyltransferase
MLTLDAPALYAKLRQGVQPFLQPDTALVGIYSGGLWLAQCLQRDLVLPGQVGAISSALHRDDFARRGMSHTGPTHLPFSVESRTILLVDDVLHTGRTTRAVINELFDFGRPARIILVVLVDRVGRELPIEPAFAAARITLPSQERLSLVRSEAGELSFELSQSASSRKDQAKKIEHEKNT